MKMVASSPCRKTGTVVIYNYLILVIVVSIGVLLRVPPVDTVRNIDETIARDVVGSMQARGDLNPDWNLVSPELPHGFGKFRYNFSSYLLVSSIFVPVSTSQEIRLAHLRGVNLIYFVIAAIVLWACTVELGFSRLGSHLAVSLLVFAPGLVHDSMMARPEGYMTALMLIYIWASIITPRALILGSVIAGIMLGLLIATKFTLAVTIVLYLFILVTVKENLVARMKIRYVVLFCSSLMVGFALGAPYAVLDPTGFIEGINNLRIQYYSSHLPHSPLVGGGTLLWQIKFYMLTYGIVFFAPFFVFINKGTSNLAVVFVAVTAVVFFLLVGTSSVFFERNLHPIIPLYILVSVYLVSKTRTLAYIVFVLLLVGPSMYWTLQIRDSQNTGRVKLIDQMEIGFSEELLHPPVHHVMLEDRPKRCGLVRLHDFSDDKSKDLRGQYVEEGWQQIETFMSPFRLLPTSTLHTYLAPNIYWFYKNCN